MFIRLEGFINYHVCLMSFNSKNSQFTDKGTKGHQAHLPAPFSLSALNNVIFGSLLPLLSRRDHHQSDPYARA